MILSQYTKFLVNGGFIGLVAWGLQAALFQILGRADGITYAIASLLTYLPLILCNFSIQQRLIFSTPGRFSRFVIASILIMLLVSALSPLCRWLLTWFWSMEAGDRGGFILAALIGATPSFLLSRFFVFRLSPEKIST